MTLSESFVSKPGSTVRDILEEKNMSTDAFAKAMHMDPAIVENWLNNEIPWKPEEMVKLEYLFKAPRQFWERRYHTYMVQQQRQKEWIFQTSGPDIH